MTKKERHIVKEELKSLFNTFIKTKKFYQQKTSSLLADIEMAKQYQVSGLPTLMVYKNGEAVERLVGLMPKSSIITNIEKHI